MTHFFRRFGAVLGTLLVTGIPVFAAVEQDIAFCYAPSYAASVGGEDNAQVIFANAAAGVNALFDQSGTGARWHIAGFYQSANDPINWTTTGGMVGWLANYDSRISDVVDFGNSVGADLVNYVVQNSSDGAAAVAQQPGMYSVVNPGNIWHVIYAHEAGGHNYGCAHGDDRLSPKGIMMHNYCGGGAAPPYFFSNPNIIFNGVRLIGDGVSCLGGSLINGGDNAWRIASYSRSITERRERPVFAPALSNAVLRWVFTNNAASAPAGTTVSDSISGAPAVVRGNGATFTGAGLRIPGGTTGNAAANSISAYIDLPNGILSSQTNITIEIWAKPLSARNWGRLLDFGRTTEAGDGLGAPGEFTGTPGTAAPGSTSSSDNIMLSTSVGTELGQQRFEAKLNGTAVTLDSGLPTTAGVQHHYAITFTDGAGAFGSAGGRWQWFRDGEPIAYVDVNHHLADLEDVNNWLGRSLWSGDAMANAEYAEVRISNIAMSRGQLVANHLLGPNFDSTATATLTSNDAIGTSSFNAAGNWSTGAAPNAGNSYETFNFALRTPASASSYAFGGGALKISGGALIWKGTSSSTITVNNLTLNNGTLHNAGSGTFTLAGSLKVTNEAAVTSVNGPTTLSAAMSGNGSISFLGNNVTLSGNNAGFSGKALVGSGAPGGLVINSEARLGTNPPSFTADQLTLNRGWLYTTTTMSIDDPNRGIRLGVSGGIFNVAAGTTLTLANAISSPVLPGNAVGGIFIKDGTGTLVVTSPTNSHNGPMEINAGTFNISGAGRLGSGTLAAPILNKAAFVYSSSAWQTLSGAIDGTGTLAQSGGTLTLSGAGTFTGNVTVNGGTLLAANGADTTAARTNGPFGNATTANRTVTINNGGTVTFTAGNVLGGRNCTTAPALRFVVNEGGVLRTSATNAAGGGGGNANVFGNLTLNGGTFTTGNGFNANYHAAILMGTVTVGGNAGSTINSTAANTIANGVMLGSVSGGNVTFNVAATGSTNADLTVSAKLVNAANGATGSLTKTGAGKMSLLAANTYTGVTTVSAGTLALSDSGSISASSTITVNNGATLDVSGLASTFSLALNQTLKGNGSINGAATILGTIAPGNSIGTLTFDIAPSLQGTALMEIDRGGIQDTDRIIANSGTLTLGGTLTVVNTGAPLQLGDNFQLFIAPGFSGNFIATNLPALTAGLAWNINPATGTLSVVNAVSTEPAPISYAVAGGNITLSWPEDHLGWRLQLQTNGPGAGLGTNWVDVADSTNATQLVQPMSTDPGSVFFRLVFP